MKRYSLFFAVFLGLLSTAYTQSVDGALKTLTASGTNTYTISEPLPAAYSNKERFLVRFTNGNTDAATLNRSGLGARAIKKADGSDLVSGDLLAGAVYLLSYNGTYYQMVGDGGGGGGSVAWGDVTGKPDFDALYWKTADTTRLSGNVLVDGGDTTRISLENITKFSIKMNDGSIVTDHSMDQSLGDVTTYTRASPYSFGYYQRDRTQFNYTIGTSSNTSNIVMRDNYFEYSQNSLVSLYADNNGMRTNRLRLLSYSNTGAANNEVWYSSDNESFLARRVGTNYSIALGSSVFGGTINTLPIWTGSGGILNSTPYTVPTVNGSNGQVLTTNGSGAATWQTPSGGVTAGDKGDITVTLSPETWTIDNLAVTNAKINDVAWSKVTSTPTTLSGYGITDGVVGDASAIDGEAVVFSGTTGKEIRRPTGTAKFPILGLSETTFGANEVMYSPGVGNRAVSSSAFTYNGTTVNATQFNGVALTTAGDGNSVLRNDGTYGTVPATRKNALVVETDFYTDTSPYSPGFIGTAISGGTDNVITGETNHPGIIDLRDGTTANGGWVIQTAANAFRLAGGEKCVVTFQIRNARTTANGWIGFKDNTTNAQPVDGAYVYFVGDGTNVTMSARTRNNSTETINGTTWQPTLNTWYSLVIQVNSDATQVDYEVFNDAGTSQWAVNNTANIPTASGRELGFGIQANESTTDAAAAIMYIDYARMEINRTLTR